LLAPAQRDKLQKPAWRNQTLALLAADVSLVIKHYAAKGRIEPNHKIDSAW
jgi:hypothetical protein